MTKHEELMDLIAELADALEGLVSAPTNDDRETLLEVLNSSQHAPMSTHHGETGECLQCPWPLHELGLDEIVGAVLAAGFRLPVVPVNERKLK